MKRKGFSILFALVLVISLSLVAVPMVALAAGSTTPPVSLGPKTITGFDGSAGAHEFFLQPSSSWKGDLTSISAGPSWSLGVIGIDASGVTGPVDRNIYFNLQDADSGSHFKNLGINFYLDATGAGGGTLFQCYQQWTVDGISSHGLNPGVLTTSDFDLRFDFTKATTSDGWTITPYFRLSGGSWTLFYDGSFTATVGAIDFNAGKLIVGFDGCADGTLSFDNYYVAGPASTVYVDDGWAGKADGDAVQFPGETTYRTIGVDAFAIIQDGIDAVAGSTVYVAPGTYDETVILPHHSLNIIGAGIDVSIWDGNGGRCIDWKEPSASEVVPTPVQFVITGFTFQSTNAPGGMIKICKVNRNQDIGFGLDFHHNRLSVPLVNTSYAYGLWLCRNSGIMRDSITGESRVRIHDNIFKSNSGICMSNSDNYDIYNNDFTHDIVGNGYATRKNAAIFIGSGCTSEQPSRGGHRIWNNSFAHVGDGYDGSEASYPRGAICIEHYSGQSGLMLHSNIIENNTFNNPNGSGVHYYCGDDVTYPTDILRWNNFSGNLYGIYVDGDYADNIAVDAEYNWWGDASGPGGTDGRVNNAGKVIGKGDAISGPVDWDPWLPQAVGHTGHDPVPPGLS